MINGLFDIDSIVSIIEKDEKIQNTDKRDTESTTNANITSSITNISCCGEMSMSIDSSASTINIDDECYNFLEELTDLNEIEPLEDDVFDDPHTSLASSSINTYESQTEIQFSDYFHDHTYDHNHSAAIEYRQKRDKNNQASRKSRLIRKEKNVEQERLAELLTTQNKSLKRKISLLENVIDIMKQELLVNMSPSKKSKIDKS